MRMKNTMMMNAALLAVPLMGAMVNGAAAQAPVIFGTDPGAAHPKYIEEQAVFGASQQQAIIAGERIVAAPQQYVVGEVVRTGVLREMDPVITQPAVDAGGFDYGYASNEVELGQQVGFSGGAQSGPTQLLSYSDVQNMSDVTTVQGSRVAGINEVVYAPTAGLTPYQQDPIYQITEQNNQPLRNVQYGQVQTAPVQQPLSQVVNPVQTTYMPVADNARVVEGTYVNVQPGDTVYALARRYGVKPNSIISANNMYAPYALSVGQPVKIPGLQEAQVGVYQAQYRQPQARPQIQTQPQYQRPRQAVQPQYTQVVPKQVAGGVYVVRQGNTLYSISRQFGVDVQTIARANGIGAPFILKIGQQIIIPAGGRIIRTPAIAPSPAARAGNGTGWVAPVQQQAPIGQNRNTYIVPQPAGTPYNQPVAPYQREANSEPKSGTAKSVSYGTTTPLGTSRFSWPIQGKIVMEYGLGVDGRRNDGINIAAPVGTPIRAVDNGEVVYRGSDLDGYGNLLLVKHSDGWVSAYAHTDAMLVRKGERVSKGQVIAKVGTTGTVAQPQLHFELRHDLKPTDPLAALQGLNKDAIR